MRRTRWRRVALGTLGIVAATACRDNRTTTALAAPNAADSADQVLSGVRFVLTTRGVSRGEMTADTAYVLDNQNRFDLRHTHVNFTTETGAPQGTMVADHAVYSLTTQLLDGRGHVVVKFVDGRTLLSPHVTYNQVTHLIASDTSYQISRGSDVQHGTGFTSNQSFTAFHCMANCGGSMNVLLPNK